MPGAPDDRDRALGEERERARVAREAELLERGRREQAERTAAAAAVPSRPATPPALTREQLADGVDKGQISQADMDRELERQAIGRAKLELREEVRAEAADAALKTKIDAFYEGDPELLAQSQAGSGEKYDKARAEFERLVSQVGLARDLRTELIALENSQGRKAARKPDDTAARRDAMDGGRAGGGGGGPTPKKTDGPPAGFPEAYVPTYEKWIKQGMFKGWSDPRIKAQMAHMRRAS